MQSDFAKLVQNSSRRRVDGGCPAGQNAAVARGLGCPGRTSSSNGTRSTARLRRAGDNAESWSAQKTIGEIRWPERLEKSSSRPRAASAGRSQADLLLDLPQRCGRPQFPQLEANHRAGPTGRCGGGSVDRRRVRHETRPDSCRSGPGPRQPPRAAGRQCPECVGRAPPGWLRCDRAGSGAKTSTKVVGDRPAVVRPSSKRVQRNARATP